LTDFLAQAEIHENRSIFFGDFASRRRLFFNGYQAK